MPTLRGRVSSLLPRKAAIEREIIARAQARVDALGEPTSTTSAAKMPRAARPDARGSSPRKPQPSGEAGVVGMIEPAPSSETIATTTGDRSGDLRDLVDRASAQLVALRRALDESATIARQTRAGAQELARAMDVADATRRASEQRLGSAEEATARAAGMLEKTSAAMKSLEQMLTRIRGASGAIEDRISQALDTQKAGFEQRFRELEVGFEQRLADLGQRQEALLEERMASAVARERELKARHDAMGAEIDRRVAQVHARLSLVLDSSSDRVATLEGQAEKLGGVITDRVEALCRRAADVLGSDPREAFTSDPRPGSLAERLAHAELLTRNTDDAIVRLTGLLRSAQAAHEKLDSAQLEAHASREALVSASDAARSAAEEVQARLAALDSQIRDAGGQQDRAVQEMRDAHDRLSTTREDLTTAASAFSYHLEQARAAQREVESATREALERGADVRQASSAALAELRERAAELVQVAREAAGLVREARAVEPASQQARGETSA
jgi:V/A-type H+-transporting ATPase subunit G/H